LPPNRPRRRPRRRYRFRLFFADHDQGSRTRTRTTTRTIEEVVSVRGALPERLCPRLRLSRGFPRCTRSLSRNPRELEKAPATTYGQTLTGDSQRLAYQRGKARRFAYTRRSAVRLLDSLASWILGFLDPWLLAGSAGRIGGPRERIPLTLAWACEYLDAISSPVPRSLQEA
jgi:hypothetical protein